MSLSASLNAGVQGLSVNSTRLSTISDNIVNANTNGYKRASTEFSSIAIAGDVEGTYTAGGVRAFVKRDITAVSTLESTTNATDIAISGNGFFAVSPTAEPENFSPSSDLIHISPTGSFQEDAEGFLRNSNGDYLLGWQLNPDGSTVNTQPARNSFSNMETINARLIKFNAVATSKINLSGPLPVTATLNSSFNDIAANTVTHKEEYFDTIGNIESLTYQFTPAPLDPTVPLDPLDPTSTPDPDVPTNTWVLRIYDSATLANNGLVGAFRMQFNGASDPSPGSIQSMSHLDLDGDGDNTNDTTAVYDNQTGIISLDTASSPMSAFIGSVGALTGITQTGSLSTANIRLDYKDGSGYGEYRGVEIDEDGIVNAFFSNDQRRPIYQIPVVTVANPNALTPVGAQSYSISPEAGSITLQDSGTRLAGKIIGYALAKSSVDVAKELTSLIETQRAYSSNAKIIQTVDEMLQETTNIKR